MFGVTSRIDLGRFRGDPRKQNINEKQAALMCMYMYIYTYVCIYIIYVFFGVGGALKWIDVWGAVRMKSTWGASLLAQ